MKSFNKSRLLEIILLFAVVLLILLAPYPRLYISNNAAFYLNQAIYLYQGEIPPLGKGGLVARAPLFPFLISLLFQLIGPSVTAAFMLSKVIYSGMVVCLYFLAKALFNKNVGLAAVLSALASYNLYRLGSLINTDSLLTFLLLLFLFFLHRGLKDARSISFVLSGLFLGFAFLVKETALLFSFLISILMIFFALKHDTQRLSRLTFTAGIFISILMPWALYVFLKTGSLLPFLGHFNPQFHEHYSSGVGKDVISILLTGLVSHFVSLYVLIKSASPLAPFLVFSFAFLLGKIVLKIKNKEDWIAEGFILSGIFLYLPVPLGDIAVGAGDPRQGFVIYCLLFISLGLFLETAWRKMSFLRKHFSLKTRNGFIKKTGILVGGMTALLLTLGSGYLLARHPKTSKIIAAFSSYRVFPEIRGRFTEGHSQGAIWLTQNVPSGSRLIVDGYLAESLGFFTLHQYQFLETFQPKSSSSYTYRSPIVFLIANKKFRSNAETRRFFWVVDEVSILANLEPDAIFAFSNKTRFLKEYFSHAPWAKLLYENPDIYIYKIMREPSHLDFSTNAKSIFVSDNFAEDLDWFEKNYPDEFSILAGSLASWHLPLNELNNKTLPVGPSDSFL